MCSIIVVRVIELKSFVKELEYQLSELLFHYDLRTRNMIDNFPYALIIYYFRLLYIIQLLDNEWYTNT